MTLRKDFWGRQSTFGATTTFEAKLSNIQKPIADSIHEMKSNLTTGHRSQTENAPLPVIIKLTQAKPSVVCQPPNVSVILIDLDDLTETSNSTTAIDLIDAIRATNLPIEQINTLVTEITLAAQYICARCDSPIPLGKDVSTPSGSMHDDCAHDYEQESPEDF